jgi:uncharacterized protein (TIGR03067 family)
MARLRWIPLLLLFPLAVGAQDPEPVDDPKSILGNWEIVKATKGGEPPPDDMLKSKFKFTADKIFITQPDGPSGEPPAAYVLNPKKTPKEIDITPPMGDELAVRGIYKLEKNQLILHANKPGAERPKNFEEKADIVLVLKRAAKEKK